MPEFKDSPTTTAPLEKNIYSYLVYETSGSTLRPRGATTSTGNTTPRRGLGSYLAKALGTLKADSQRKNAYHVEEGCVQVRQTIPIDHFYFAPEVSEGEHSYESDIKPIIDSVFDSGNDALIVTSGYSGTPSRVKQLHGTTLDLPTAVNVAADSSFTFVAPPTETWGTLLRTVQYVIQRANEQGTSVAATAVRVQLDNVVDALISPSALKVKFGDTNQGQRIRQQYTRLLALTSASTLDVDDDAGVAKIADQTVCNLHTTADFYHIINCFSATAHSQRSPPPPSSSSSTTAPANSGGQPQRKTSAPSHCLTTLRLTTLAREVRRIHFLELSDFDWTSNTKEDQEEYTNSLDNLIQVLSAIAKRNDLTLDSISRKHMLTHVLCSQLRPSKTTVLFYGHTRYSHSLDMMRLIGRASSTSIKTVLHGPDLEGEMEVDAELRSHLEEIQKECEQLQRELDDQLDRKQELDSQIRSSDEQMARIEQRRATMRRMTFATRKRLDPGQPSEDSFDSKNRSQSDSQYQREQSFINAAKCYTLREELKELKRTHVKVMRTAQKQLEILTREKTRGETKVSQLQAEYDKLKEKWKVQTAEHAKQKEALRKLHAAKMNAILEARRSEAEKRNQEHRQSIQRDIEQSKQQAGEMTRLEQEAEAQWKAQRVILAEQEAAERAHEAEVKARIYEAQQELALVEQRVSFVTLTDEREERKLQSQLEDLEQAAAVLDEFAFRMSSLLSTVEKRMHNIAMVPIVVHEPQLKISAEVLDARSEVLGAWLSRGGLDGPVHARRTTSPQIDRLAAPLRRVSMM